MIADVSPLQAVWPDSFFSLEIILEKPQIAPEITHERNPTFGLAVDIKVTK